MSTPSLALGLLNHLITIQDHPEDDQRTAPEWADAFIAQMEQGTLRLSPEEAQAGLARDWPVVHWAATYARTHGRAAKELSEDRALRLFSALLDQTEAVQAWQVSGQPMAYASGDVLALNDRFHEVLADQDGNGSLWLPALAQWVARGGKSLLASQAQDTLITALTNSDFASLDQALILGADATALDNEHALLNRVDSDQPTSVQLALLNRLLAAGARPDQPDGQGEYPEELWWRAEGAHHTGVPPQIEALRQVGGPPHALHRIEQVLAFVPRSEFEDRLARAGVSETEPYQGRSWSEWLAIGVWNRVNQEREAWAELGQCLAPSSLGRNHWSRLHLSWQAVALRHHLIALPAEDCSPVALLAMVAGGRSWAPGGLDALADWLERTPELNHRARLASRGLMHVLRERQEQGEEPGTGSARYVTWLDRVTRPEWSQAPRDTFAKAPIEHLSLGTMESDGQRSWMVPLLSPGILEQLSVADQAKAAQAWWALLPMVWLRLPSSDQSSWKRDPIPDHWWPWMGQAMSLPSAIRDPALAALPWDLRPTLEPALHEAEARTRAQTREAVLAHQPSAVSRPRSRPRA